MKEWDLARAMIETLPPLGDQQPEMLPLEDAAALAEIHEVMSRPDCRQAFPEGNWTPKLVEISKIIPFQPNVDVEYAERQRDPSLVPPNLMSAVKLCFPRKRPSALAIQVDEAQKAITVSGINPALQIVGLQGGQQNGEGPFVISLYISPGPNIVQVPQYRGRNFLSNGYHRVYGLVKAGFTRAPCAVKEATTLAETGALGAGFFSEALLMSARPPLFADFSDKVLGIQREHSGTFLYESLLSKISRRDRKS